MYNPTGIIMLVVAVAMLLYYCKTIDIKSCYIQKREQDLKIKEKNYECKR